MVVKFLCTALLNHVWSRSLVHLVSNHVHFTIWKNESVYHGTGAGALFSSLINPRCCLLLFASVCIIPAYACGGIRKGRCDILQKILVVNNFNHDCEIYLVSSFH